MNAILNFFDQITSNIVILFFVFFSAFVAFKLASRKENRN